MARDAGRVAVNHKPNILLIAVGERSFPRGLADIYLYLKMRGHNVEFLNLGTRDLMEMGSQVINYPDYVGVSCITQSSRLAVEACQDVRTIWDQATLVVGGKHFSQDMLNSWMNPSQMWEDLVDYIVIGEGEYAFAELVENGNLSSKVVVGTSISLEDYQAIGFPGKEFVQQHFPIGGEAAKGGKTLLFARRCPYACTYCSVESARTIRKEPDRCVDYMKQFQRWVGGGSLFIEDDVFARDRGWLTSFVNECKKQRVKVSFECFLHHQDISSYVLESLYSVGLQKVSVGCESGDDVILKSINKSGATISRYLAMQELFEEFGQVGLHTLWMIGNVGETEKTIRRTLAAASCIGTDRPWFSFAIPFPGTKFWQTHLDHGEIVEHDVSKWGNKRVVFVPEDLTKEKMYQLHKEALEVNYECSR